MPDEKVVIEFEDGELAEAEYVVGAHRVWSRVCRHFQDAELPFVVSWEFSD